MSTTAPISSNSTATANNPANSSTAMPTQTLNQQDFLNLLVTQLQNQDPMNPMSDTDFIAQMAQFSTLQQSQQTYQSISEMQANNMIGSTVHVSTSGGVTDTGVVSGVIANSGSPQIVVNGAPYDLSDIQTVMPTANPTTSITPTSNTSGN